MLILPKGLPVKATLQSEGFHIEEEKALAAKNCLRILLLNLMPEKKQTELDISRMLAGYEKDVELILMKISGQQYKTTPQEYMQTFYLDFEQLADGVYDGLIVTGAPVEQIPFEEVRYWEMLCRIMDWADSHVKSTLYICWGAQAALYHFYGIQKHPLLHKKFGIFPHAVNVGVDSPFYTLKNNIIGKQYGFFMPVSRHTEILAEEILPHSSLHIIAESKESGVGIVVEDKGHRIYITGHLEYATERLDVEYHRDLKKGLPIQEPINYYSSGAEDEKRTNILNTWHSTAETFYHAWLKQINLLQA